MTLWLDPPNTPIPDFLRDEHPLIARTLVRRGIASIEQARAFLDPDQAPPVPASTLPGMDAALERVSSAIRAREPICVWGDFDVDGQTATALLVQTLRELGANVTWHIPIRAVESHGIKLRALTGVIDQGASLILTCDTGISALEEVEYARSRGVDFVITDHHDLPEQIPHAVAVVNPKLLPEEHPLASLPGVGVAYKLAEALLEAFAPPLHPSTLLDLTALGIVADIALLHGETRTLLQRGLAVLRRTGRLGLRVMAELAGLDLAQANEDHIGFTIGPRLNALGRLGDANPIVELLTTQDPARARVLAAQLEGLNTQRKLLTDQVTQAAEAQLRADPALLAGPAIVLEHPAWPGGVVGIVASRLVERYHKPAILFSTGEDGLARGSARSVEGINISEAIAAQQELLHTFGGHPMAAGLSLQAERLPEFRRALGHSIEEMLGGVPPEEPNLPIDAWLSLGEINLDLAGQIARLAPYGPGNPSLTFAAHGLRLQGHTAIGRNGTHLKLRVQDEAGATQDVLWWNSAVDEEIEPLIQGAQFDLAFRLSATTYRGTRQTQVELSDYRITAEKPIEVKAAPLEIVDLRSIVDPQPALANLPTGVQVWAEAEDKLHIGGRDRFELESAPVFAIWTSPPGPSELRAALQRVKPHTIYLFAVSPASAAPETFLTRLAGLAKFAINQRGGAAAIPALAAATAQREPIIRLGLEWLAAGGHLQVQVDGDQLALSTGDGVANPYLQEELYTAVKGLLDESAAYREHFRKAETQLLA
jgi:single-stranded-DNA-specific exonuclease